MVDWLPEQSNSSAMQWVAQACEKNPTVMSWERENWLCCRNLTKKDCGVLAHLCNSNPWESRRRGSWVWGQFGLSMRLSQKKNKVRKRTYQAPYRKNLNSEGLANSIFPDSILISGSFHITNCLQRVVGITPWPIMSERRAGWRKERQGPQKDKTYTELRRLIRVRENNTKKMSEN